MPPVRLSHTAYGHHRSSPPATQVAAPIAPAADPTLAPEPDHEPAAPETAAVATDPVIVADPAGQTASPTDQHPEEDDDPEEGWIEDAIRDEIAP